MVDNRTTNKNYPLPHPSNIASQDVTRIANAISMIDSDIAECDSEISAMSTSVNTLTKSALKIPAEQVGIMNTELQDLEARKYIVVNSDATGFSAVEGGGGGGGKKGEILIKRSDINFDTTWVDPRSILKQSPITNEAITDQLLPNNGLVILRDSAEQSFDEQLPARGITAIQSNEDIVADAFCGYIIKDTIESENEEDDIASATKFGRVKIGSGINVANGVISVPIIGMASKNDFGLVKIGDGLNVSRGVISAKEYQQADHETYGIIKLGDDFIIGNDGELLLANKNENEGVIYQASKVKLCSNYTIAVEETYAVYRLWVNEDCLINFDWSLLDQKHDATFDVELYSSDNYIVAFSDEVIWSAPCAGVVAGKTVVRFTKRLNMSTLEGKLISQDESAEKLLTVYAEDDIAKNYTCHCTGTDGWPAYEFLKNTRTDIYWEYSWPVVPDEDGAIFQIDFMKSTYVTKVDFGCTRGSATTFFYIEASLDGINWTKQYQKLNQSLNGDFSFTLENRGYFRHYRIRCASNVVFSRIRFWGHDVDDRLFELRKITPQMFSDSQQGYILTSHATVNDGALKNITNTSTNSYAGFNSTDEDGSWWIKYELPEAKVVDFIDIASGNGDTQYNPSWFKIEGSNDDENWTLLIEKGQQKTWNKCQAFQYFIDNTVAYKYYKLTIKATANATSCRVYRWRLYKKEDGISSLENFIPVMLAASQDGYIVSAESQYNNEHAAVYAFDGNSNTRWSSGGGAPSWLQIQFPTAVVCTAYQITSRNDYYYNQAPRTFVVAGSNNGTTWQTLDSQSGISFMQNETKLFDFENNEAYLYYRLYVTENNGGGTVALGKFEIGKLLKTYKKDLNVLEYLIPSMSSNSQNGYELSVNSIYSSDWDIWKCFDHDTGTSWSTAYDSPISTIQITLPEAKICNCMSVYPRSGLTYQAFGTMILYGSNDGETWIELLNDSSISAWTNNVEKSWEVENTTAYSNYKLVVTPYNQENCVSVANINLCHRYIIREY